jgi:N-acetylmuramic acid 6-phosphate etherase
LVAIAASGRTPYVLGAVARAQALGAITCGISCTPDSELSRAVDYPIEPKPGPEVLAGSTRLRAGTATKLVLNMISTAVMIRLGHVYGNQMVNVQPTNPEARGVHGASLDKLTGARANVPRNCWRQAETACAR